MLEHAIPECDHPRPQLQRTEWTSLDGEWDFALDPDSQWALPEQVTWDRRIRVPFSPETKASGVGDAGFYRACWYRRTINAAKPDDGRLLILHFGAIDYTAKVWVNGQFVAKHDGGYTPFHVDITDLMTDRETQTIVVRAEDDPQDLSKPRGKQDWQLVPHSIWYPRTTGIWQTVWMEWVPATHITYVRWTPNMERWEIGLEVRVCGPRRRDLRLRVRLQVGDSLIARDDYSVVSGEVHRRIALSDPGIDDSRNELLWFPGSPTLIEAQIELRDTRGQLIDSVRSYTALRSIGVQGDRFILNGRPYRLRMVLNQGYWTDTGVTAPDDQAMRRDVELIKSMGFNGVRMHQKIESPRFLYWCDVLGLVVWEEMPSAYRYTKRSIKRLNREWTSVIERDVSHPCIVAWVPFNESWGVPDLPDSPAQRHYVQALYHLTKSLDPTRPVIGNDGWESVATDIIGIHDYEDQPQRLIARYGSSELTRLFRHERPGDRQLVLGDSPPTFQVIMLTEFGGIALSNEIRGTWGYSRASSSDDLASRYSALMAALHELSIFAGFCYTQFADTFQEANGLLYADRTPKVPLAKIAEATRGPRGLRDLQREYEWREHLMKVQRLQYLVPAEDYRLRDSH